MNIDWINDLISQLPETSSARKNLISIAGYPKWENVNSNLLAFYLDEKEEHNFSRLFLNALISLLEEKQNFKDFSKEFFETEFSVEREISTLNGNRIDILLKEETEDEDEEYIPSWAIIIENKLYAILTNDLADYWRSVKAENKIGIVLSIQPFDNTSKLKDETINYVNITHKELIDRVKQNLPDFYIDADDRHLLFLKEYFSNVYSFYKDNKTAEIMDKTLQLFHSKKDELERLKKMDLSLLRFVSKSVMEIMGNFGFLPSSQKDSSKGKHFYASPESEALNVTLFEEIEVTRRFRFFVNISQLRYNATFIAYFELWNKDNTIYGDKLKDRLSEKNIFTECIHLGRLGKCGAGYQHIFELTIPLKDFAESGFAYQLEIGLKEQFFEHKNQFLQTAVLELKNIIESI